MQHQYLFICINSLSIFNISFRIGEHQHLTVWFRFWLMTHTHLHTQTYISCVSIHLIIQTKTESNNKYVRLSSWCLLIHLNRYSCGIIMDRHRQQLFDTTHTHTLKHRAGEIENVRHTNIQSDIINLCVCFFFGRVVQVWNLDRFVRSSRKDWVLEGGLTIDLVSLQYYVHS